MQNHQDAENSLTEHRAKMLLDWIELTTLSLCLQRGIDQVTVDDIANAEGVSAFSTFYRYFDTIDDVLCAMPRRGLAELAQGYKDRPPHEGVIEAFIQMDRKLNDRRRRRAVHLLAVEVAQRYPAAWWRATNRMQPSAQQLFEGAHQGEAIGAGPGSGDRRPSRRRPAHDYSVCEAGRFPKGRNGSEHPTHRRGNECGCCDHE